MSAVRVLRFAVVLPLLLMPSSAGANSGQATTAVLTATPQNPAVGQGWQVKVSLQGEDTRQHHGWHLRLSGEMMGHPMPPIETVLSEAGEAGSHTGALTFTMRGPWRVTLRLENQSEALLGAFDMDVVNPGETIGADEMHYEIAMVAPVRPTLVRPWTVVFVSVAGVLAMQAAAVFSQRRRQGAARAADPARASTSLSA
jgi:hypothetical protein